MVTTRLANDPRYSDITSWREYLRQHGAGEYRWWTGAEGQECGEQVSAGGAYREIEAAAAPKPTTRLLFD